MYLHVSRRKTKVRGKTSRKSAAYKAKKQKRRVNGMLGAPLGRRPTRRK